ncbi:MAG: hypothetical protein O2887_10410 [Bacteroidetes bacterium]|nr:hypothetical protein [Bacteroidota bacterium]
MGIIEFVYNYWELILSLAALIAWGFKQYYTMQHMSERVTGLEEKIKINYEVDLQVTSRIDKIDNTLGQLLKSVRAIMKHLKMPDIL